MLIITAGSSRSASTVDRTAATSITATSEARSKVLEFNDNSNNSSNNSSSRLALQIIITEPSANSKKKSKRPPASILLARKRPYDLLEETLSSGSVIEKYSPWAKHFYVVEPHSPAAAVSTTTTAAPTLRATISVPPGNKEHQKKQHMLTRRPILTQRSELVKSQHRPPWMFDQSSGMEVRRYFLKFKTTLAPLINAAATTEFFRLISSAHSPLKFKSRQKSTASGLSGMAAEESGRTDSALDDRWNDGHSTTVNNHSSSGSNNSNSKEAALDDKSRYSPSLGTTTLAPADEHRPTTSRRQPHPTAGSVTSPALMFGSSEEEKSTSTTIADQWGCRNCSPSPTSQPSSATNATTLVDRGEEQQSELYDRRAETTATVFNTTLGPNEMPLAYSDGKKIITLVRHKPRTTPAMTQPPSLDSPPSKILIQQQEQPTMDGAPDQQPNQSIRLISKQRHKYDDRVLSPTLTVVDNDALRVPPNATSVHNNRLVVAIRPGRPGRRPPSTTQFPEYVYNLVGGRTPPYTTHHLTPVQYQTRPPSIDGSVYGLLKPTGADAIAATTPSPSTFGAANIKFPAAPPPLSSLQPSSASEENHLVESIEKLNISVPASSSSSSSNVPNRIQMQTEELHLSRPVNVPSETIVMSNSTLVSRPYDAHVVVSQDSGIIRLKTTRRPPRPLSTTKKINIVSANTTIVATNADQLHDVLSNFITGSHHQQSQTSQKPPERPGFFASLGNLLNASVTTSAVAILTLIKTIFVAVLVMFLPPIALTAAIMQAINIG